jgi:hypothetical protein
VSNGARRARTVGTNLRSVAKAVAQIISKDQQMEFSIRARSIELTDPLRELVTKRIQLALDTFGDRVKESWVYLMDLNGPKGGVDKLCQVGVHVRGVGDIVVREKRFNRPRCIEPCRAPTEVSGI